MAAEIELTYDMLFQIGQNHWLEMFKNEPDIIRRQIQGKYSEYYIDGQLDVNKFKLDLTLVNTKKLSKAKELFKCLNYFPHKYVSTYSYYDLLENIVEEYGNQILAHGVEEAKGGRNNLLLIAIANCICIPADYWGPLSEGLANISALSHGPYYLIYTSKASKSTQIPINATLDQIESIVVPFQENIEELTGNLDKLKQDGFIDDAGISRFTSRLETYKSFNCRLELQKKESILTQFQDLFFQPDKVSPNIGERDMELIFKK